jgi:hypothetical protein
MNFILDIRASERKCHARRLAGDLRGWAPVTRVQDTGDGDFIICRRGDAVACTVPFAIPGFRGLRQRWWDTAAEVPFPDWRDV